MPEDKCLRLVGHWAHDSSRLEPTRKGLVLISQAIVC